MSAGHHEPRTGPVWQLSLDAHCQPFADDERWRQVLRRFFLAMASELPAFYASAEVTRGNVWAGRSMWSDAETEWAVTPARKDRWLGLPPYPTWWAWYGEPYRSLVDGRLPLGEVTAHDTGLFHELAASPVDRDELTRAASRRRRLRRAPEWAPPDLFATVRPHDGGIRPVPLEPAETIPPALR